VGLSGGESAPHLAAGACPQRTVHVAKVVAPEVPEAGVGKGVRSMPGEGRGGEQSLQPWDTPLSQYWHTPVAAGAAFEGVLVGAVAVPAAEAVKPGAVVGVAGAGLGQVGEACGQLGVVGLGSRPKPVDHVPAICTTGQRAPMLACRPRLPPSSAALI
jgi:hypothetical protein